MKFRLRPFFRCRRDLEKLQSARYYKDYKAEQSVEDCVLYAEFESSLDPLAWAMERSAASAALGVSKWAES